MAIEIERVLEKYKALEKVVRAAKLESSTAEGGSIESVSSDAMLAAAAQLVASEELEAKIDGVAFEVKNLKETIVNIEKIRVHNAQ